MHSDQISGIAMSRHVRGLKIEIRNENEKHMCKIYARDAEAFTISRRKWEILKRSIN